MLLQFNKTTLVNDFGEKLTLQFFPVEEKYQN